MLDLSRVSELVGDLFAANVADGGLSELTQHLETLGLDVNGFDSLASQELMQLISEQGVELGELDAASLMDLARQAGIELPFADLSDATRTIPGVE